MKNKIRSTLLNVLCGFISMAGCSFSSMALPQTAKPSSQRAGTSSSDSIKAYRMAMKKIYTRGDNFDSQDAFLKAVRVMDHTLLSDLNERGPVSVPQLNANLKNWRLGNGQFKGTENYELSSMEGSGQPYVLAASYDTCSTVRIYAVNSEGLYEVKTRLDNTTSEDYQLVGMRFVMISPKDGVFVTLFGTEHFDCFVWQFNGEKVSEIWSSEARNLSFLRVVDDGIVFSKDGWQVRYSWTKGSWVEQPLNIPAKTPDVIGRLEMRFPLSPCTISACAFCF